MGRKRSRDLTIFISLLIVTIIGEIYAGFLFCSSFNSGNEISFYYTEDSSLKYKVWLKGNDFYSEEYLGEDYDVIASAIDMIEVDFNYDLTLSDYVKGVSYYTINSKIVAFQKGDANEKKIWDYNRLIKDKVIMVYDVDTINVNSSDNFKIDYQMYRTLMDNYKKNYGVSLIGNLIVEIDINTEFNYAKFNDSIDINNRKLTLTIPLTESVVKITKNDIENNTQNLIEKGDSYINYLKLSLSLGAFVLGFCLCVFLGITLVKLVGIDSKYNRELKRILRTYGSIIVNVKEFNIEKNKKVIYVDSFNELLDAQQELRKPILYYNVRTNKKALFVLRYDNDLLIYEMCSDLYNNKKK